MTPYDTTVTPDQTRAALRYLRGRGLDVTIEDGTGGCCWTITDEAGLPVDGGVVASTDAAWTAVASWAEGDRVVSLITFGVLLAAVAEHGLTRKAAASAAMAVAGSHAFAQSSGRPESLPPPRSRADEWPLNRRD